MSASARGYEAAFASWQHALDDLEERLRRQEACLHAGAPLVTTEWRAPDQPLPGPLRLRLELLASRSDALEAELAGVMADTLAVLPTSPYR